MDPDPKKRPFIAAMILNPQPPSSLTPCELAMHQVSDPHLPPAARIAAVETLASECRDHRSLQIFQGMLPNTNDDLAVRGAIVRALPRWDGSFFPLLVVTRALSIPGLRPVAIDTLEKLGPVTGTQESRLLSEIRSPKTGSSRQYAMSVMPGLYGRDPRFLKYLAETLRTGNQWERALAASELYGLGDVERALEAARDPEARVRKSLAAAIRWYGDERGRELLPVLESEPHPAGWRPLLEELSAFRLTDPLVTAKLSRERIQSGWLGEPGAGEAQIQALEHRVGRTLPPSYRAFLATSDGFLYQSTFISKMYGAADVEWFRVHNADWVAAYRDTYPDLGACLQVSAVGDAAVVLLNPGVVAADGEWQTYFFANWVPGAREYRSFQEFMESEIDNLCEWRDRHDRR